MQRESYVHGNSGPPLIGKTIGALLDDVNATDGTREALVVAHQKIRRTYAELKSRPEAFASGLLALGLEPGDRVGIWSLATIDDDGYCRNVGRIKDMVIRGGENIYPREVEEYLYRHPEIQDVQVFGVPDAKNGEELCACVISKSAKLDAEGIHEFCQDRIAHYKIPRHIRIVECFPSTVTGKVQKFAMCDAMIEEFADAAKVRA